MQAVGMLFRCEACPTAFCEDHLPAEADITQTCARFATLGVSRLPGACYVRCSSGCAALVEALEAEAAGKKGGKARREAASQAGASDGTKKGGAGAPRAAAVKQEPGAAGTQSRAQQGRKAVAAVEVKQEAVVVKMEGRG